MSLDFPLHFDSFGRTASCDDDQHVRDLIDQLLFTNPGERVNRPDFGSGILQLMFAPNSVELASALKFTAQAALQRHLGDLIDVQEFDVAALDATLSVTLKYVVRKTGQIKTETFVQGSV
jgi:phage baseplate assembly protein W